VLDASRLTTQRPLGRASVRPLRSFRTAWLAVTYGRAARRHSQLRVCRQAGQVAQALTAQARVASAFALPQERAVRCEIEPTLVVRPRDARVQCCDARSVASSALRHAPANQPSGPVRLATASEAVRSLKHQG
jgi:hypothetical protein